MRAAVGGHAPVSKVGVNLTSYDFRKPTPLAQPLLTCRRECRSRGLHRRSDYRRLSYFDNDPYWVDLKQSVRDPKSQAATFLTAERLGRGSKGVLHAVSCSGLTLTPVRTAGEPRTTHTRLPITPKHNETPPNRWACTWNARKCSVIEKTAPVAGGRTSGLVALLRQQGVYRYPTLARGLQFDPFRFSPDWPKGGGVVAQAQVASI